VMVMNSHENIYVAAMNSYKNILETWQWLIFVAESSSRIIFVRVHPHKYSIVVALYSWELLRDGQLPRNNFVAGFIVFVTIFTLTKNTSRIYSLPWNNCRTVPLRPSGHRICGKRKGRGQRRGPRLPLLSSAQPCHRGLASRLALRSHGHASNPPHEGRKRISTSEHDLCKQ
jgi:hypothetical protein